MLGYNVEFFLCGEQITCYIDTIRYLIGALYILNDSLYYK